MMSIGNFVWTFDSASSCRLNGYAGVKTFSCADSYFRWTRTRWRLATMLLAMHWPTPNCRCLRMGTIEISVVFFCLFSLPASRPNRRLFLLCRLTGWRVSSGATGRIGRLWRRRGGRRKPVPQVWLAFGGCRRAAGQRRQVVGHAAAARVRGR